MAENARKHTVPAGNETNVTRQTIFESALQSINDVIPVANTTERSQVVADLVAEGVGPAPSRPVIVIRGDAPGLHRIEYSTDGTVWLPASGVLTFASKALADSWATANGGLLAVNDIARIGSIDYRWTGTAWWAQVSGLNFIRSVPFTAATAVAVDGVFSSAFDNYLLKINIVSASSDGGAIWQLRAGGTPLAGGYTGQYLESAVGIGPTRTDAASQTSGVMGRYAAGGGSIDLELFSPALASAKRYLHRSFDQTAYHRVGGGYNASVAAQDGIGLAFPTTATGVVKVYGYA